MYDVDSRDEVIQLTSLPPCDPGAPLPCVTAAEHVLRVAYISLGEGSDEDVIVTVSFDRPYAHMFGPPNDEAFEGHPLADRGLRPYGAFRVDRSSWVRRLERMNSVHEQHSPEHFERLRHFVLSFHDSTFECVAEGFDYTTVPADGTFTLSVEIRP